MPKHLLEVEMGDKTCAISPGKFCRFARANWSGQGWCSLFEVKLWEDSGWLARSRECLDHFKEQKDLLWPAE